MNNLTLQEYEKNAIKTALYPNVGKNLNYVHCGLGGETGEFLDKLKKVIRDNEGKLPENLTPFHKELGDCLWYLTLSCFEYGTTLQNILNYFESYAGKTIKTFSDFEKYFNDKIIKALYLPHKEKNIYEQAKKLFIYAGHILVRNNTIENSDSYDALLTKETLLQYIIILSNLCDMFNVNLEYIAKQNNEKLLKRLENNTIKGSGDNR